MSHLTKIKVEVRSLDILKAACQRLALQFVEGQTTYQAWYKSHNCNHAIKVPGSKMEIGIVKDGESYNLVSDNLIGYQNQSLGVDCQGLIQMYAVEAAKEEAQRQGFSTWEETLEDGSVQLHVQTGE